MKNYRKYNKSIKSLIACNECVSGESIERKMERVMEENQPIEDVAEIAYTDKKDGVRPETDIRTDRFEIALEAMNKVTASRRAKREEAMKEPNKTTVSGEAEPTQVNP
ncbi:MAG: hypothetical protein NC396_08520 [Bacteroides sp.]|nr:hypothetical protein [Bacteroides sp.]MCM1085105.1 hypothetical protein [Bacteroides sp.]